MPMLLLIYFAVTYPLDVVRRRMQMKGIKQNEFAYRSTLHAFSSILQKEGVRGLYKGILPNLIKVSRHSWQLCKQISYTRTVFKTSNRICHLVTNICTWLSGTVDALLEATLISSQF